MVRNNKLFFLLTCCHVFMEEDREQRKRMTNEDFTTALMASCKEAKFEIWVSKNSSRSLAAEDVLENCENPVICFDQVQENLAVLYRVNSLYTTPYCDIVFRLVNLLSY